MYTANAYISIITNIEMFPRLQVQIKVMEIMIEAFTVLYTYCYMTYNKCNSNFYVCFYQEKESILFLTKLSMKEEKAASKQAALLARPSYMSHNILTMT